MEFLVNKNFLKSVPIEMREIISNKIMNFSNLLQENNNYLYDLPKGFWVKKIKQGNEEFFEFRINSGDRIIFDIMKRNNQNYLRYLYYSKHDRALDRYEELQKDEFSNLYIEQEIFDTEKVESIGEQLYWNQDINIIDYKIEKEEFFEKLIENPEESLLYCLNLNEEQFQCLEKNPPVIISGGAGSGKTAVLFNKMLNMDKNREVYENPKIVYFTLSERLKSNVQEIMNEATLNSSSISFFSIHEFFLEILSIPQENYIQFEEFKKFLINELGREKKKSKSKHDATNIYTEINGVIKGMMFREVSDNWDRNIKNPMISLEEYLSLKDQFSIYSENDRKEIYQIAEIYQKWLEKNGKHDLNDLCRVYIQNGELKVFDYLFIDEVQDLTELQIFVLTQLSKNREKIFFAGDIHQVVTMNHFNFSRLSNLYEESFHDFNFLSKNYRSKSKVIEAANKVKELRKKYIGSLSLEYELHEEAIVEGGEFSIQKVNMEFLRKTSEDANFVILVATNLEKTSLLKELGDYELFGDMVFTVEEAKGLEFNDVVCYNLTTPFKNEWDAIFSGKAKKNQNFRYYFNLLYVGFTRAKSNIIMMEKEIFQNKIISEFKEIGKEKVNITSMIKKSSAEEWNDKAIKLEKLGKIKEAEISKKKAVEINENLKIYKKKFTESEILDFEKSLIQKNDNTIKKYLELGFNPNHMIKNTIPLLIKTIIKSKTMMELISQSNIDKELKKSSIGITALSIASKSGDDKIVKLLLGAGANPNIENNNGVSILFFAAFYHHGDFIDFIHSNKKELAFQNNNGDSALTLASSKGHKKIIELLLGAGANINFQCSKKISPLICSISNGHKEIIEFLLKNGANIDLQDNNGWSALMHALSKGDNEIVELLLENGAVLDIKNNSYLSILMSAASDYSIWTIEFLLKNGININSQDNEGLSALMYATENEIVELLLKNGANIDLQDNNGSSALIHATLNSQKELIEFLLKNGADANLQDNNGISALMISSYCNHDEYVKKHSECGFFSDEELLQESQKSQEEIVELLLNFGATPDLELEGGATALMLATEYGHEKIVELLLNFGSNPNSQLEDGATALMYAAQEGNERIVETLLSFGANSDLQSSNGATALMYATQKGHKKVEQLLMSQICVEIPDREKIEKKFVKKRRTIFNFWSSL